MANVKKDVKYIDRDFGSFRKSLIDFAKTYFPSSYTDFNETDPGMMFIEMAAYVGDVLSYYTDKQFNEGMLMYAQEPSNLYAISNAFGYKAKNMISAATKLDVYQLLPAKGTGVSIEPDYAYALRIEAGMGVAALSNSDITFYTQDLVDFAYSGSLQDPTYVNVYLMDTGSNEPLYYLLRKQVTANSGRIKTATFAFTDPKPYDKILVNDTNVIAIVDVTDSDGNIWYEVPFLAQDTIMDDVPNIASNDPELSIYQNQVPYLLKQIKTARRFVKRLRSDNKFELQFGAGTSSDLDEEIVPNPNIVYNAIPGITNGIDAPIDSSNYLATSTYGVAPTNTTLTIRYYIGNGIADNVLSDDLQTIISKSTAFRGGGLDTNMQTLVLNSVRASNPTAAYGGRSSESVEEIRNNVMALFASQNRAVTKDDYIIRSYSMPPKFGSIAKSYIVQADQVSTGTGDMLANPLALNLYTLGYDQNKKLIALNPATKENLKNYISLFRILTDAINIMDAYIINIGIDFEVTTLAESNNNEILLKCIDKLKQYFDTEKWQINQPIIISEVYSLLMGVYGVTSVPNIDIMNVYGSTNGYSDVTYNIKTATSNGIIYPSKDPCIFEVRFKNKDIRGKVVSY